MTSGRRIDVLFQVGLSPVVHGASAAQVFAQPQQDSLVFPALPDGGVAPLAQNATHRTIGMSVIYVLVCVGLKNIPTGFAF